jgi:hypothetical protein
VSGEIEALGDLATAGMAAAALDAPDGGKTVEHGACANCGAPLTGSFCAACGQKAHVHRSLVHVGEEILHGVTHFDGKAWTTLPMLVFRPGKLTRDYIEGKRARYIAPVPLFLLVVFLMFFVFSFVKFDGRTPIKLADSSGKVMTPETARRELPRFEARLAEAEANVAAARRARDTKGQAIPVLRTSARSNATASPRSCCAIGSRRSPPARPKPRSASPRPRHASLSARKRRSISAIHASTKRSARR